MIRIRKMDNKDLEAVYLIEKESFQTPWSFESFYNELHTNHLAYYAVVEEDQVVVAYGGLWRVVDEAHITNVAVLPRARGKGYSKRLMNHLIDYSRMQNLINMTLEVRVSNRVAIHLYTSIGFKEAGIRPKYYQDTKEDALILWLAL